LNVGRPSDLFVVFPFPQSLRDRSILLHLNVFVKKLLPPLPKPLDPFFVPNPLFVARTRALQFSSESAPGSFTPPMKPPVLLFKPFFLSRIRVLEPCSPDKRCNQPSPFFHAPIPCEKLGRVVSFIPCYFSPKWLYTCSFFEVAFHFLRLFVSNEPLQDICPLNYPTCLHPGDTSPCTAVEKRAYPGSR